MNKKTTKPNRHHYRTEFFIKKRIKMKESSQKDNYYTQLIYGFKKYSKRSSEWD